MRPAHYSRCWLATLLLAYGLFAAAAAPAEELLTVAEKTDYQATSRHAEVMAFCQALGKQSPLVRQISMGKSNEGRDLPLLILSDPPIATPEEARRSGKIVVMAFANIHAGEVEGKEAMQMLARELTLPQGHPLLKKLVILINPILNADGNEKIDPKHRAHQGGPTGGVGLRENAQGLDLNRDFVKLRSPEIRALVDCFNRWDPWLIVDCHSTNGTFHRFLITYDGPRHPSTDPAIHKLSQTELLDEIRRRFEAQSPYKGFFYGFFTQDRTSWYGYPPQPRYGIQYVALRNRLGILSEAYTYADFKDRVAATKAFVLSNFQYVVDQEAFLRRLLPAADQRSANLGMEADRSHDLVLHYKVVPLPGRYDVLGYVEEVKDGKRVPTSQTKDYPVTYLGGTEPTLTVKRPWAYVIPPEQRAIIETLQRHGVELHELTEPKEVEAEITLVNQLRQAERPFQNVRLLTTQQTTKRTAAVNLPSGSIIVPMKQRLGTLAGVLLEAESEDGFLTWNLFGESVKEGADYPVVRILQPMEWSTRPLPSLNQD